MLFAIGSLWVAFIAAVSIAIWFRLRGLTDVVWVAVFVLVVGLRVVLFCTAPFYGQEYEDAYEYIYAGMVLSENPEAAREGLNPLCGWGTIHDCDVMFTLSHPVGASVFYSMIFQAVDDIASARIVGLVLTGLIGLMAVYAAASSIDRKAAGPILFMIAMVPLVSLYSITGFSEVVGASVLAGFLLAQVLATEPDERGSRSTGLVLLFLSTALLGLIKRELLIVPLLAALPPLREMIRKFPGPNASHLVVLVMGTLTTLLLSGGAVIDISVARTSSLALFSISTFAHLVPEFLKTAITGDVFLFFGVLLLCAVSAGWAARGTWIWTAQIGALLAVGLAFSQSYYYAIAGEVPVIHFERYSFVLWPLVVAVLVGLSGKFAIAQRLGSRWRRTMAVLAVSLVVAVSVVFTIRIGNHRVREEQSSRFEPVRAALEVLPSDCWLVTLDPIIVSLVDPERNTIDLASLASMTDADSFAQLVRQEEVGLLLRNEGIEIEKSRYEREFALFREIEAQEVHDQRLNAVGFSVFILAAKTGGESVDEETGGLPNSLIR